MIPCLYPLGWAMVALGDLEHASNGVFAAAYVMFLSAFVWSLVLWLTSDTLASKNPSTWNTHRKKRTDLSRAYRSYWIWKYGVAAVMAIIVLPTLNETSIIQYNKEMSSLEGTLYPANDPTPQPCFRPPGKYVFYFPESNFAIAADRLPLPLFVSRTTGKVLAQAEQLPDDSLGISMDIESDDKKIVVQMKGNEYVVNHNNYLQINRRNYAHDKSTLRVTDQTGKQVLSIHFLNPHAFSIAADLKLEGRELDTSKLNVRNGCLKVEHGPEGASAVAF